LRRCSRKVLDFFGAFGDIQRFKSIDGELCPGRESGPGFFVLDAKFSGLCRAPSSFLFGVQSQKIAVTTPMTIGNPIPSSAATLIALNIVSV
jgi:hypothetical protein